MKIKEGGGMDIKPKKVLVWRNGRYEVKTLPLSKGGRVGKTTQNIKEANEVYRRWVGVV